MSDSSTNKITIKEKISQLRKKSSQEKVKIALENFFSVGNLIHFRNREHISGSFVVIESPVVSFTDSSDGEIRVVQINLDTYLFDKICFGRNLSFIPVKINKIIFFYNQINYWTSDLVCEIKSPDQKTSFSGKKFTHLTGKIFSIDGKNVLDLLKPLKQYEL